MAMVFIRNRLAAASAESGSQNVDSQNTESQNTTSGFERLSRALGRSRLELRAASAAPSLGDTTVDFPAAPTVTTGMPTASSTATSGINSLNVPSQNLGAPNSNSQNVNSTKRFFEKAAQLNTRDFENFTTTHAQPNTTELDSFFANSPTVNVHGKTKPFFEASSTPYYKAGAWRQDMILNYGKPDKNGAFQPVVVLLTATLIVHNGNVVGATDGVKRLF